MFTSDTGSDGMSYEVVKPTESFSIRKSLFTLVKMKLGIYKKGYYRAD